MRRPVPLCSYLYDACTGDVEALYARTAASKSGPAVPASVPPVPAFRPCQWGVLPPAVAPIIPSAAAPQHTYIQKVPRNYRVVAPPPGRRPQVPVPPRFQIPRLPRTVYPPPSSPVTVQPPSTPVGACAAQGIVAYVAGMLHVAYVAGRICLLFTVHRIS